MAIKEVKSLNLNAEAINTIIDSVIIKHSLNTNTLDMYDLNRFHLFIVIDNLNGIEYPDFAIYKRRNFSYNKLTTSPIYLLLLNK